MKRNEGILAFLTIFFSSLVSAGPVRGIEQLAEGLRETIVILIRFIGDLMLDIDSFDEFLFAKLLLFVLILIITYTVIKQNSMDLTIESSRPEIAVIARGKKHTLSVNKKHTIKI